MLIFMLLFSFAGCGRVMDDEADYIRRARKEFHIADADTIEMKLIGEHRAGEKVLLWFVSGNEYQTHHYLPMSCFVAKDGGYVFDHAHKPLDRGTEIVVVPGWQGGYAFCVNNPECKTIKIDDYSGVREIEVTEYPFIYYNKLLPGEYFFLDENGEAID